MHPDERKWLKMMENDGVGQLSPAQDDIRYEEVEMTAYAIDIFCGAGIYPSACYPIERDARVSAYPLRRIHARHNSNICSITSYEDDDVRM